MIGRLKKTEGRFERKQNVFRRNRACGNEILLLKNV